MKLLCFVLLLGLSMPACSMLTKSGRQERAYSKYVKKMSAARDRQRKKEIRQQSRVLKRLGPQPVSEPVETIQVSEGQ